MSGVYEDEDEGRAATKWSSLVVKLCTSGHVSHPVLSFFFFVVSTHDGGGNNP